MIGEDISDPERPYQEPQYLVVDCRTGTRKVLVQRDLDR